MPANTISTRPATGADAAGIARVHVDSWRFAYRDLLPQPFLDGLSVETRTQFWQRAVANPLPRAATLVAVQNERVLGFCSCGPSREPDAPGTQGEISAIYVDPEAMRQGIGRRLMDAALDHLASEGFTDAILWVLEGNAIGRGFYERYGWKPAGITRAETIGEVSVSEVRYHLHLTKLTEERSPLCR